MESKELDMNLYNGDYDALLTFAGVQQPVPVVTDEYKLNKLWEAHKELW
jgi:hypothetical protein